MPFGNIGSGAVSAINGVIGSGDGSDGSVLGQIPSGQIGQFEVLQASYDSNVRMTYILREGGKATEYEAAQSIFNPFNVFRYSRFGVTTGYNPAKHRDVSEKSAEGLMGSSPIEAINASLGSTVNNVVSLFSPNNAQQVDPNSERILLNSDENSRENISNPTAKKIIEWSQLNASSSAAVPPAPYALTDFIWCRDYGKVPNNRLLTLRRYPIPVQDNLRVNEEKMPLIPIAQAVSWFGEGTGNSLGTTLGINYGFNWTSVSSDVQTVEGNEIPWEDVYTAAGIKDEKLKSFITLFIANQNDVAALSGYDKKLQEFARNAYGPEGPYWNRILGPVNVINSTQMRSRGFTYTQPITLTFNYSLRSYNLINPKIAMLDLISNFLSLTYNTAPFWGGGYRYFRKTGLVVSSVPGAQAMEDGDMLGALVQSLSGLKVLASGAFKELSGYLGGLMSGSETDTSLLEKEAATDDYARSKLNLILAKRMGNLIQTPLKMKALLDGRAVGEWHLTVGNPMNPIAVIGNLIVKSTKITFSEELGEDDFPTGVSFQVTLDHGRPRAKQDIESMFNLGAGKLSHTPLAPPASAINTFGEANSQRQNLANSSQTATNSLATSQERDAILDNVNRVFKPRIKSFYGEDFAMSKMLPDYFYQLKTKD
jgi:hypothetical protein